MMRTFMLASAFLLVAACGPKNPSLTVADDELTGVTGEARAAIDAAGIEVREAQGVVTTEKRDRAAAKRELEIADEEIKKAEAELAIARMRLEEAQETGRAEAMLPAQSRRKAAEHALQVAKAGQEHRKKVLAHHDSLLDRADKAVFAAKAKYEAAKFEALMAASTETGPEQEERRAKFQAQVAEANLELAESKTLVARAKAEADRAQGKLEQVQSNAPAPAATATPTDEM